MEGSRGQPAPADAVALERMAESLGRRADQQSRRGYANEIDLLVQCRGVEVATAGFDIKQLGHSAMLTRSSRARIAIIQWAIGPQTAKGQQRTEGRQRAAGGYGLTNVNVRHVGGD